MKTKLLLLLLFTSFLTAEAQLTFGKSTVSDNQTGGVYGVLEKDLDNDGDLDLMSASAVDNTLAYYINDGTGNFTQYIITNNFDGASFIDGADFDNDGDMDFVATGTSDLSWFENDNGTFIEHNVAAGLDEPLHVRVYDIGTVTDPATPDGDIDIGLLISGENNVTIYMNDGNNSFSRLNLISINSPKYLNGGDFDGNNTDDFLISSYNNGEVKWYKLGAWGFELGGTVTDNFDGAFGVEGGDIDLDGDDDVIATAFLGNEVAWFENDGNANFTKHSIDNNLPGASFLRWNDIDNDGDKDIIVVAFGNLNGTSTTGHQVVIYYNDGNQNFTKSILDDIEEGPATFCLQDFNGDSNYDIIFAASISNKILMLEQGGSGAVNELDNQAFNIYPNPTAGLINIDTEEDIDYIEIRDITGRKILTTRKKQISVTAYNKGNYILQIYLKNGDKISRKILFQ